MGVQADRAGFRDEPAHQQRRRERELSSLYATARSLTALGEVDEVITSIVRYAHDLMGTDCTYLSIFDSDGQLNLRASEGSISAAFKSASVSRGIGVAAHIVETSSPYWVCNYQTERHIRHSPAFDRVLIDEGLVALLGVPLLVSGQVIGILYAAHRQERQFQPEEVALLSAFADHAAIALENARLYDERKTAIRDLQSAYDTIESHVAAMTLSASVHEALTEVVLAGGGAADVARLLVTHLGGSVAILDRSEKVVATVPAESPPAVSAEIMDTSRRSGRCVTFEEGGQSHSVAAVLAGTTYLGSVVLSRDFSPAPVDTRTLERSAQIIGLLTLKEDAFTEAEERVRGELLTEILTSRQPLSPIHANRAQARGIDVARLNTLVVVDAVARPAADVARRLNAISTECHGLAGEHAGRATILIHARDVNEAVEAIRRRLRGELNTPVLVVADRLDSDDWGRSFTLASRCCSLLTMLGQVDRAATTDHYGLYAIVFDPERRPQLELFLGETLKPLLDYDRRRSTELVATLAAYFANSGNLTQTARSIHVHMNTLIKRLDRVGTLLGEDWKDPETALRLHLAVRLEILRSQLDSEAT
jgi:hypothetical protein